VYPSNSGNLEDGTHSWVGLFLQNDIHIVGLGLDYQEFVLWWLLGFKQRLKNLGKRPCGTTTYYAFVGTGLPAKRLDLMTGLGVEVKRVTIHDHPTSKDWSSVCAMLKRVME
jgi:hypothetical protein